MCSQVCVYCIKKTSKKNGIKLLIFLAQQNEKKNWFVPVLKV